MIYGTWNALTTHLHMKHLNKKTYSYRCDWPDCVGWDFSWKKDLTIHKHSHIFDKTRLRFWNVSSWAALRNLNRKRNSTNTRKSMKRLIRLLAIGKSRSPIADLRKLNIFASIWKFIHWRKQSLANLEIMIENSGISGPRTSVIKTPVGVNWYVKSSTAA